MKSFILNPKKLKTLLSILFFLSFTFYAESQTLTYEDIISKIYDLPALANLPEKGEKGALFSSYDRRTKYDEKSDAYIDWNANIDSVGLVRKEGEYSVLADIKGPGVIWRMWAALVADGKIEIYLDGKLVINLPWKDYFSGKIVPFNRKGLVYEVARGLNNYTPISFQKSCKIMTKAKIPGQGTNLWGQYYHFNYTVFPKDTKIQTFKMKLSSEENKALDKANEILTTHLGDNPLKYKNFKEEVKTWIIQPGKSQILKIDGKRAITALKIQIPKHKNYNDLLRQLTISINWDNQKLPAVWSPLGDFFGTAPGINEYKSLVMGMTDSRSLRPEASKGVRCQVSGRTENGGQRSEVRGQDSPPFLKGVRGISTNKEQEQNKISNIQQGISNNQIKDQSIKNKKIPQTPFKKGGINPLIHKSNNPNAFEFYSYWYMPFEKNAKITIKNESDKPQQISIIVKHEQLKSSFANLGYFHAKWHRDLNQELKHGIDWEILKTKGRGRFVGFSLHIWNAKGGWWGEGDEKFFVDGEKFPSTIGTGSEDYFGYAWCRPEIFSTAYHCQTTNFNNRGHVSNNRWHIGDNIPFQKSFDAYIEKYYKNSRSTFYAGVAYWYLSKGGDDEIGETPLKNRLNYYAAYKAYKEKNALEGEELPIKNLSNGKTRVQDLSFYGNYWSNEKHLWWTDAGKGDFIELEIDSPDSTTKNLTAQLTKAVYHAIIQLYFNGEKIGNEIDCYDNEILATGKINFGKVKIKKGKNILKIKIIGLSHPQTKKLYMVGLDYIKFE